MLDTPCPLCPTGHAVILCCAQCWGQVMEQGRKLTVEEKARLVLFLEVAPPLWGYDRGDYIHLKRVLLNEGA